MNLEDMPCRVCGEYELEYFGEEDASIFCPHCGSHGPTYWGKFKTEARPKALQLYLKVCVVGDWGFAE